MLILLETRCGRRRSKFKAGAVNWTTRVMAWSAIIASAVGPMQQVWPLFRDASSDEFRAIPDRTVRTSECYTDGR